MPRSWQTARYTSLFEDIHTISEEVDVVVIGGDIFDSAPTLEETALFMDYVQGIKCHTIIYDGNHEATKKGESFFPLLARMLCDKDVKVIRGVTNYMGLDFVPYTDIKKFSKVVKKSNVLLTHIRGNIEPHVKAEIDLTLLDKWPIVLSGDLHAYSNCQRNILYPGSPLSINFHRTKVSNGIIIFDTDTMLHEFVTIETPQLIKKIITDETEAIKTKYDHTVYEVEGTLDKLAGVTNKLISKKIVSKNSESSLQLGHLTREGELKAYWQQILNLNDNTIEELMHLHNDNN